MPSICEISRLGQLDRAKADFDKALDLNPGYVRARENRAILFGQLGDWTGELTELAIILHLSPNDQWAKDAREAALQKQLLPDSPRKQALRDGIHPDVMPRLISKIEPEYTDEARRAGVSARIKPDWPDAYRFRGLAYSYSGQHGKALRDYQKAIELNPDSADGYNALGSAYTELGQLDLAKTNLDKAIKLDPNFILARQNRAKLFAKQGNLPAEQNELTVIHGLNPNQSPKDPDGPPMQKLP